MSLEKGVHQVTCRECGAKGEVRIGATLSRGKMVRVQDNVQHLETCPHYRCPQPRHLKQKRWRGQEKRMNEMVGARDTLASGSVGKDGDGRAFHQWRTEAKQTASHHYRLTQEVWTKLVRGALETGEEPVLHVRMMNGRTHVNRVVIRHELWSALDEGSVHSRPTLRNTLSYRLTVNSPTPLLVELNPLGVMLTEHHFLELKDRLP